MKAQGAFTMATTADKLKSNLGSPHLGLLLTALLDGLSGRTWTGKVCYIDRTTLYMASRH
jgi:proteasome component ECM29